MAKNNRDTGIIVISFIGNGMFEARYLTENREDRIGEGTKKELTNELLEFTSNSSKTYTYSICKEWEEYE